MARSEVNYTYEADLALAVPGTVLTASAAPIDASVLGSSDNNQFKTATGIDLENLDKMVNAREGDQKNKLGGEFYDVVIAVQALDLADLDETYQFNVYVGAAGAGVGGVLAGATAVVAPGQYVVKMDAHTIEKLSADREEIAVEAVLGGTTPSITFAAWLAYGSGN